jgi:glycosyltransferase involved in cell wall biosynthesis
MCRSEGVKDISQAATIGHRERNRESIAKPKNTGLSIIVPVYNEEQSVAETAKELFEIAKVGGQDAEVIFVNDGSWDGTAEALKRIKGIRVISHPQNRGYGAALKTGIKSARHSWIAITDADGTYPNRRIPQMLGIAQADNFDMVVGSRNGESVRIPLIRRPAKWFLSKLASYLCNRAIPDLNSGLRVFHREALNEFIEILPDGFSFTTTITLALLSNSHKVKYIPIEYYQRKGSSKIRPVQDTLNFIQLIIRMVMYFNPLRVFLPMSFLLFASSLGSLIYRAFMGKGFASLSVILFIAGIQVLTTGMIADFIDRRLILANNSRSKGK